MMEFVAEMDETLECRGYTLTLTPWGCILNQLSDYCLPGFPCETCQSGVTIQIPPSPPLGKGGEEVYRLEAGATRGERKPVKLPAWLKNASRAVRRDYLRELEGKV